MEDIKRAVESNDSEQAKFILQSCTIHQIHLHGFLRDSIVAKSHDVARVLLDYGACPLYHICEPNAFELAVNEDNWSLVSLFASALARKWSMLRSTIIIDSYVLEKLFKRLLRDHMTVKYNTLNAIFLEQELQRIQI